MRRIVVREFGNPSVMRLEEMPTPSPGPSEVLVRIHAAGVNPVETYIRSGSYARKPSLPYVPGSDGAGVVELTGPDIDAFKPGDRVYIAADNLGSPGPGTYADYAICSPTQLHPLPDRVSFAQGAAIGVPYATAARALFIRAGARPADIVLVHGATGGVGIAAVELAHARGMVVIGTGGTERGMQLAREHGADFVCSHHEANYLDAIMRASNGRGVDIILEMAAHINLDKDLTLLAKGGRIVVIGNRGRIEIDPRGAMGRDAAILGMLIFNAPPSEIASIHAAIVAGLRNGTLNPAVGRQFPLAEAARAHEAVMEPGAIGKIVLLP
jgi:NADPH2:quinone reductase